MNFLVIDLETTGLDPAIDEIIEIGAVKIVDSAVCGTLQTLVKPGQPIPDEVVELTGISNEMLLDAPSLNDALQQLKDFAAGDFYWVAHNKAFEASFLNPLLEKYLPWIDTIDLAKILLPLNKYTRLGYLLELFAIEHKELHRALADAQGTADLLLIMLEQLCALPDKLWRNFMQICQPVNAPLADLLREMFAARTSNNRLVQEGAIGNFDSSSFGYDLDEDTDNSAYFLPTSEIADFFDNLPTDRFEVRDEQITMSKQVVTAFNDHQILLAEAGTGTGKSLAYLLPAALFSVGSNQQVIISTNTINLQEQLLHKDIPILRDEMKKQRNIDFRSAVLKGRANYLCLRKWRQARESAAVDTLALYLRIEHWLMLTTTGDYSELNLWGRELEQVEQLNAGTDSCLGYNCTNSRASCFVTKARHKASTANILIVNHSWLLSAALCNDDGVGILPSAHHLIIDEAHQLAAVAERQFSQRLSAQEVTRALNNLGQTQNLLRQLQKMNVPVNLLPKLAKIIVQQEAIATVCRDFETATQDFFASNGHPLDRQIRIVHQRYKPEWKPVEDALSNLLFAMRQLINALNDILNEANSDDPYISFDTLANWQSARNALAELMQTGQCLVDGTDAVTNEDCVIWLERHTVRDFQHPVDVLQWWVAPVDIRPLLQRNVFSDKRSIIFTSATLANNDFSYFSRELGLESLNLPVQTLMLPSPFDYPNKARIFLTDEVGDYTKTSEILIQEQLANAIARLVLAAKGRALVLFTSYQQLNGVYSLLLPLLHDSGIKLLGHGVSGGRNFIIESMQKNPNCCVLGVSSFWEGVDIKGDNLSLLIIVRLPFAPPNTPLLEARFERIKEQGGNPFRDYSLPQAILRMKQGFGRLIRSKEDRGVCCILDQRICNNKGYGSKFLAALPQMPVERCTIDQMAEKIKIFLGDN